MKRNDFIHASCSFCLLSASGLLATLSSCSPAAFPIFKTEVADKKISVPLKLFDQAPLQIVRPKDLFYDIAVQKKDNVYTALQLLCTHQQNQLTVTGSGYTCNLHGSQFDRSGNVRKGPAERPLRQLKTTVANDTLLIDV